MVDKETKEMFSLVKDDTFDKVLKENMSVFESHVNNYYISFKKLLNENRKSYYNHEFLYLLFNSAKFKNLLLRLESVDKNYGYYEIKRDFYWTGRVFKKCTEQNDFCKHYVMDKMNRTGPVRMDDL